MKKRLVPLVSVLWLQGCIVAVQADEKLSMRQQQLTLSSAQLNKLIAETGAGALQIIGEPNRTQIDVAATIYSDAHTKVELSLVQDNQVARLVATTEQQFSAGPSPRIDLMVRMPAQLALTLTDGSGNIDISGLTGAIVLNDGSGDLRLKGAASLQLTDGSGDIDVSDVSGNVQISDGSGHLRLHSVGGDTDIEDGSGDLRVSEIGGTVRINDGSGDIDVRAAAALIIADAGSGDLHYQQIRGKVQLPPSDDEQI